MNIFFIRRILLVLFLGGMTALALSCADDGDDDNDNTGDDDDAGNEDTSDVPVPEGCTGEESIDHGKDALADHDLDGANFQFGCSWAKDNNNARAAGWYAMTMLAITKDDAKLNGLAERSGGHGDTDPWNFNYTFDFLPAFPGQTPGDLPDDTPMSSEALSTTVDVLGPVLKNISALLSVAAGDPNFADVFPTAILTGLPLESDRIREYEIDIADVYYLWALVKAAQGALEASQAWQWQVDIADFFNGHKVECFWINDLLEDYPDWFTLLDNHESALNNTRQYAERAMVIYREFLNALAAETDKQSDDLVTMFPWRQPAALIEINQALASLEGPVEVTIKNVWWDSEVPYTTLKIDSGALADNPWDRSLLPTFYAGDNSWDECYPYIDLSNHPDLTMNGVFPGITADELFAAYAWMLHAWLGVDVH